MKWFLKCLKQYADFKGRARRREYWFFQLFYLIFGWSVIFIVVLIEQDMGRLSPVFIQDVHELTPLFFPLYGLAMIIPYYAVTIRRLHDTGNSGWMFLIIMIPIIGWIWLFVLLVTDSKPVENKWGPNPKSN